MTRSSHRWQSKPGSFDALHTSQLFWSDNKWGIPLLAQQTITPPAWLVPYRQRIRSQTELDDGGVHFFTDDYRFESVWNRPNKGIQALQPYTTVLTPDFSLYRDWPLTLQLWNTYRNRWCGCLWQTEGFQVVPTVSWSSADSYAFCFAGVPPYATVAISAVGVNLREPLEQHLFMAGLREMLLCLKPRHVLCYGKLPSAFRGLVTDSAELHTYPTRWTNIRAARRCGTMRKGIR